MASTARCPTCGTAFERSRASSTLPFCSQRCRLVDLGRWLDGAYSLPGEPASPEDVAHELEAGDSNEDARRLLESARGRLSRDEN